MKYNKSTRNGTLDLVKFVAVVLMVIYNSRFFAMYEPTLISGCTVSLDLIFMILGFFTMKEAMKTQYQKTDDLGSLTTQFMLPRMKNILPEFIISIIIAVFLMYIFDDFNVFKNVKNASLDFIFVTSSGKSDFKGLEIAWIVLLCLLLMAILYPLIAKNVKLWKYLLTPAIGIMLAGILMQNFGDIYTDRLQWNGLTINAFPTGFSDMCLGCTAYTLSLSLGKLKPKKLFRLIMGICEGLCYIMAMALSCMGTEYMLRPLGVIVFFTLGLTISGSGISFLPFIFNRKLSYWLSVYARGLFLGHCCWAILVTIIWPKLTYIQLFPRYIALSLVTGCVITLVATGIRKLI